MDLANLQEPGMTENEWGKRGKDFTYPIKDNLTRRIGTYATTAPLFSGLFSIRLSLDVRSTPKDNE
jgi:hypothetical protein